MTEFHSPHKALSRFSEVYDREILDEAMKIERYGKYAFYAIFSGVIGAFFGFFWVLSEGELLATESKFELFKNIVLTLIMGCGVGYGAVAFLLESMRIHYKGAIFPIFEKMFGWDFKKGRGQTADLGMFEAYHLLPNYREAVVRSRLRGRIGNVQFLANDLFLKKNSGKNRKVVFTGTVMMFHFPRAFKAETIILDDRGLLNQGSIKKKGVKEESPDSFDSLFKEFVTGHDDAIALPESKRLNDTGHRYQRVELVSPEFEKQFEAYSTDQVEARVLLTPGIIENLVSLASSVDGRRLRFAFVGNRLLIAFEEPSALTPRPIFSRLSHRNFAQNILNEVSAMISIVKWANSRNASFERQKRAPSSANRNVA